VTAQVAHGTWRSRLHIQHIHTMLRVRTSERRESEEESALLSHNSALRSSNCDANSVANRCAFTRHMPHEINHVWTHIISLACAHPPDTALQRQQGEQPPLAPPLPIYLPVPSTHFQRGAAVEEGRGGSGGRGRGQSISGNEYDNSGAGVRIGATWPRAASETAHCTSLSHPWQYSSTCHCVTSGRASPQISWTGD